MHGAIRCCLPLVLSCICCTSFAQSAAPHHPSHHSAAKHHSPAVHIGKARKGKASYYAKNFAWKKMADGTPMNPNANIAASRTLPLGTIAKVTNLENGKSEIVEIRDRGPYVDGRIIDLAPKVARKLDMIEHGVVPVVVTPLDIPGDEAPEAVVASAEQ